MNIGKNILHSLYSKKKYSSARQLEDDFNDYPPKPLTSRKSIVNIDIVSANGIGQYYQMISNAIRLFSNPDISKISLSSVPDSQKGLLESVQGFRESISTASKDIRPLNVVVKGVLIIFALMLSPLVIFGASILLMILLYRLRKTLNRYGATLGYYISYPGIGNEVVVQPNCIEGQDKLAVIISHEHIHLLQWLDDKSSKKFDSQGIVDPSYLLDERFWNKGHYNLYLMQRHETEARLHELVLSYYRVYGLLPLSVDGFLELLSGGREQFGQIVAGILDQNNHKIGNKNVKISYATRSSKISEDLVIVLASIKNMELRYEFITEVLTVMYANLIYYYGDEKSSMAFFKAIPKIDLYLKIYSVSAKIHPHQDPTIPFV